MDPTLTSLSSFALVVFFLVGTTELAVVAVARSPPSYSTGPTGWAQGGAMPDDSFVGVTHDYARFADVERHCREVLASATALAFNADRAKALQPELSFVKGDWRQDDGAAPLLPFDGRDAPANSTGIANPLPLATFALTDVDTSRRSRNALNVSGVLGVAISRNGTGPEMGRYVSPEFTVWPGISELKILFEGVYTETDANGGEQVLCLLGDAALPERQPSSSGGTWGWLKSSGEQNFNPPTVKDDKILLIIRYPKTFTLTSRAITSEMTSLNAKSSNKYFDAVHLSSQLGAYSNYKFGAAQELVSSACSPYPYDDGGVLRQGRDLYTGASFCGVLDRFVSEELFTVSPNWNCTGAHDSCRNKLGPFQVVGEVTGDVGVIMQDVRCEPNVGTGGENTARVSAVFRAVPSWEPYYTATRRSGLDGSTVAAEGVWNSSAGQLCMVGCLGGVRSNDDGCRWRICFYIQTGLSITRRSIVFGRISAVDGSSAALTFQKTVHPSELWTRFSASTLFSYNYTKYNQAAALPDRSESVDLRTAIAKSLLSFPTKGSEASEEVSLSNLADDLTVHVSAVPEPIPKAKFEKPFVQLEVLSLGPLVGRRWSFGNSSDDDSPPPEKKLQNLNVSAELTITGAPYADVSLIYLEGVYSPADGRMYLVGCRDARAAWRTLTSSAEKLQLDEGLDCLIEVKVEYPPTTARWLINPTAMITITSMRDLGDVLRFNLTKLQTLPFIYREQRQDILSRRSVEGILRILTLSVSIACETSQLLYVKANPAVAPYVSLVMLGVQALGYSVPLVTGVEALFNRITAGGYEAPSYKVDQSQLYWIINCVVKLLVLAAFLLTLRLAQKVWRSRVRMLTRAPLEPGRVPRDDGVLRVTAAVHAIGFCLIALVHYITVASRAVRENPGGAYIDSHGRRHQLHDWALQLEEYIGLTQDFFLLPQIVGNYLWRINCMPVRKSYYVGVTAMRLLPHVYDFIRAPAINPYFAEEYDFVNTSMDFFSKFGDVAIPLTAMAFMATIYVQQRWSYKIISKTVKQHHKRLQHLGSRVYERLPSMSSTAFEAELVAGVNGGMVNGGPRGDNE